MNRSIQTSSMALLALALAFFAVTTPSCGGGSADGAGRGLALLAFHHAGVDNTVLNARLSFEFSENVDPASIGNASLQIREGPSFGATVHGAFVVAGNVVYFEPQLAGLCDHSDSGLKPDTQYRVQIIGFPEEFAIRNTAGQALDYTQTYEFHTREDTDPNKYDDQIPGVGPNVTAMLPDDLSQGVPVVDGNRIVFDISENLIPCSVDDTTVLFSMYESGDPAVFATTPAPFNTQSGFSHDGTNGGDTADQAPLDFSTWGSGGTITTYPPQKLLADIELVQTRALTQIVVTPTSGTFPENALLVVQITSGVTDYGNQPMTPISCSFTTENLLGLPGTYVVENEGETPWNRSLSTADVNTPRSPGLVQGYMLFAGDGDNGNDALTPGYPNGVICDFRVNSGVKDDFDPSGDVLLDTGSSVNTCNNSTDGSTAVIWEFATMWIRSGHTVRVVGKNPAIFLVQGDVTIENGATFKARGVSSGDNGRGADGGAYQGSNGAGLQDRPGGKGVAGGGNGGTSENANQNHRFGDDGNAGFGSPDYDPAMPRISPNTAGSPDAPEGAGSAGQSSGATTSSNPWDGSSAGGGGGGHAEPGEDGGTNNPGTNYKLMEVPRSFGGVAYESASNSGDKMQTPEAGSGGGSAGFQNARPFNSSTSYVATGGAGGAGGGFIDVTSSGDIRVSGTIDVAGGRGGSGSAFSTYVNSGGGGGGSGGGVRLLTPNDILLASTAVVTASGGAGGIGVAPSANAGGKNDGGAGGNGRVVLETNNGVVSGLAGATVIPGEGAAGFFRGAFDANRFQGGGLKPEAVSDLFACGAFNPTFTTPVQGDFIAGVPVNTSLGTGKTAMLIEIQGYDMLPDATPGPVGTGWYTVGHFLDSGLDLLPTWTAAEPTPLQLPAGLPLDNNGFGISNMLGMEFIQLRITMYLPSTIGPFDPATYLDQWTIRFDSDQ